MKNINKSPSLACTIGALVLSALMANSAMATSIKEHRQLASEGFTKSQNIIGGMYYKGTNGVSKNSIEAARWFGKSAQAKDLQGIYSMATQYHFGDGVMINYGKAIDLYTYAAEHGHADAAYNLGTIYFNGFGTEKNIDLAKQLYAQACEGGSSQACAVQLSFTE